MHGRIFAFVTILVTSWTFAQSPEVINADWNKPYHGKTAENSSLTIFRFPVQRKSVARVIVSCNESDVESPLLVVFRERTAIISLQVPILIQNYEYNMAGRTLCPFDHAEADEVLTIEVSSFAPVRYEFKASLVKNFTLRTSDTREVEAAASEPIYLEYRIPEGIDSVVVHIDSNSSHCMTVSIQQIGCPVFDLTNNVISTGSHQTMTFSASIVVERIAMPEFYVIFVVNPNDNLCSEMFDIIPTKPRRTARRSKVFNVTIESASQDGDYILPVSVAGGIICIIYIFAIIYMVADYRTEIRYLRDRYSVFNFEEVVEPEVMRTRAQAEEEMLRDDESIRSYDTLPDSRDKLVIRAKRRLTVADMSLKTWKQREKKYRIYLVTLATVGLFYGLPVVQLVLTWQKTVRLSGDLDLCYYNFRCARPFLGFFAFNNLFSNCGYVLLGLLLIIMNKEKEMRYHTMITSAPHLERYGLPQHGGLMNSIGLAVILEGILSASYHICPSSSNYQFDTSFMYVIGMLGMLKLYQLRHPDVNANAHVAFALIAFFILLAMCGVYMHNFVFWSVFSVVYILTMISVSIEFYFKGVWKMNLRELWNSIRYSYFSSKRCSCIIPAYAGRFLFLIIANLINITFLMFGFIHRPKDFASFLLLPFIANLFLYLVYYIVMKVGYREKIHPRAWVILALATICWCISSFFFLNSVSDWSQTPAHSRELNRHCLILRFFDNHDMWHFFSAIAIFLSFTLMNRIDDDLQFVPREEIVVF